MVERVSIEYRPSPLPNGVCVKLPGVELAFDFTPEGLMRPTMFLCDSDVLEEIAEAIQARVAADVD